MKSKKTPSEIDIIYSDSILLAQAMGLDLTPYRKKRNKRKNEEKEKRGKKQKDR